MSVSEAERAVSRSLPEGPAPGHASASPVEIANRALKTRPVFTIKAQIATGLFLLFLVLLVASSVTLAIMVRLEGEIRTFKVTSKLLFEIDQARRFEKNFFRYGSNLDEALENVYAARRILNESSAALNEVEGEEAFVRMQQDLGRYAELLEAQVRPAGNPGVDSAEKARAEVEIRLHGRHIVAFAADLIEKEKARVDRTLLHSRYGQMGLIVFFFGCILGVAWFLNQACVAPIGRFTQYTQRMAEGDHTPITPVRRYRDEFSELAIAFNLMLEKLEHRHQILTESHKLRAIGTLTAGVAHELNNPINNITLTVHGLKEDYRDLSEAERCEMMDEIIQEADRAKKIVASLLDFARKSESHVEPIELGDVVERTVRLAQNQLALKGVRANLELASHLPRIHGDAQQLTQVLLNLILNALDVSPSGGTIDLSLARADEPSFLCVRVADHGSGIPDHVRPFVFDPFFTTKSKGKGAGLGLSISRGIVEKHGGNLTFETKTGEGTTFIMCLPVTSFPVDFEQVSGALKEQSAGTAPRPPHP